MNVAQNSSANTSLTTQYLTYNNGRLYFHDISEIQIDKKNKANSNALKDETQKQKKTSVFHWLYIDTHKHLKEKHYLPISKFHPRYFNFVTMNFGWVVTVNSVVWYILQLIIICKLYVMSVFGACFKLYK